MKLYEITIQEDDDNYTFLKVSDKTQTELREGIENDNEYSCLMWADIREITEVDGYRIKLEKIYTVSTETNCIDCCNYINCEYMANFAAQYNMYKSGSEQLKDNMVINCNYYKAKE